MNLILIQNIVYLKKIIKNINYHFYNFKKIKIILIKLKNYKILKMKIYQKLKIFIIGNKIILFKNKIEL